MKISIERFSVPVFISFVFFACFTVFSQNKKIDSLKNIVQTGIKDTAMVSVLNLLSTEILNEENIPLSLEYSNQAYVLANTLGYKEGMAYSLKNIGMAEYYQGNYLDVLDYWSQSLETFESIKDTIGITNMLNNLGAIYWSQGSNDKALDLYLQSLSYAKKINDPFRITSVLPNIGSVYGDLQDYDNALKYYNEMEQYLQAVDNAQITSYYLMGIGEIYSLMGNYDMALKYHEEALPINKNTLDYAHNLTSLGIIEFKRGNIEKSINYLNLAVKTSSYNNQQWEHVWALIELGKVYQNTNFNKALSIYQEAELLAEEINEHKALRDIYYGSSEAYANKADFKNAFRYQKQYLIQKDSLFNLETDDKIRGLQFDFDLEKKEDRIGLLEKESEIQQLNEKRQRYILYGTAVALAMIILMGIGLYKRYNYVKKTNRIIEEEKNRSENLLLNILPEETAHELKQYGKVKAKKFDSVTVLFTDFKGFTHYAHHLSPEELVESVDFYFSKFDEIMEKYGMEKIKTIGDAYMCAGGLPFPTKDHPYKMVQAAFEIAEFIEASKKESDDHITHFDVRIGINTGPIVAGVVGIHKFAYDIWGDTVNVASRMETLSTPGRINISEYTYELIKDEFDCEYRGEIDVKNKGMMKMYFVNGMKEKVIKRAIEESSIDA